MQTDDDRFTDTYEKFQKKELLCPFAKTAFEMPKSPNSQHKSSARTTQTPFTNNQQTSEVVKRSREPCSTGERYYMLVLLFLRAKKPFGFSYGSKIPMVRSLKLCIRKAVVMAGPMRYVYAAAYFLTLFFFFTFNYNSI